MYQNGTGLPQSYKKAFEYYRIGEKQKSILAHFNLGEMHRKGQGVRENNKEAVRYYFYAANRGFVVAQLELGKLFYRIGIIEKDITNYVPAHKWLNLAGSHGDKEAIRVRDLIEKDMTLGQIKEAQEWAEEWAEEWKINNPLPKE